LTKHPPRRSIIRDNEIGVAVAVEIAYRHGEGCLTGGVVDGCREGAVASGTVSVLLANGDGTFQAPQNFNVYVIHAGHAFGFDGSLLACIDLADGQRKWKGGRYGHGQLILLPEQDLLLVLSEKGELALVGASPDQFRERAKMPAILGKT
jgi:hypothetical protein